MMCFWNFRQLINIMNILDQELKANSSLIGDSKPVVDESNEPIRKSYEEHLVRLTENVCVIIAEELLLI